MVCLMGMDKIGIPPMNDWYFAKNGQQLGPVSSEEIKRMITAGELDPTKDLVWNPRMTDWLPAFEVPELIAQAPLIPNPGMVAEQPFAYQTTTGELGEIEPGSEPIIATACVKRAFDLTVNNIGPILIITIIYVVISMAVSAGLQVLDHAMGLEPTGQFFSKDFDNGSGVSYNFYAGGDDQLSPFSSLISSIISVFFMLGATRIGLRIASGHSFDIGMLFSGARWLIKGFIAYFIYMVVVTLGFICLIVPGIFLMVRLGAYMNAMVERDMGIIESLKYSWNLTRGNGLNLFVILLFSILVIIAGCIALIVGLLFAFPMMWLMWIVAYRWMQYGGRAVLDDPATGEPLLAALPETP